MLMKLMICFPKYKICAFVTGVCCGALCFRVSYNMKFICHIADNSSFNCSISAALDATYYFLLLFNKCTIWLSYAVMLPLGIC